MKKTILIITVLLFASCFLLSSCSDEESDFVGNDARFVSFSLTVDGVFYPASIIDNQMSITIPYGTDLSNAEVSYQLSENATVSPDPKSIVDWSGDQVFRVQSYNNKYSAFTYSLSIKNNEVEDNIVLLTQADVDAFASKNINSISGNLILGSIDIPNGEYDAIKNLEGLSSLKEVHYNIVINNSFASMNLDGLSNLEKAGGIYLGTTSSVAKPVKKIDIELPNLQSVGNLILNSDSLTSVLLPKLGNVSEIYISSLKLKELNLNRLYESRGDLILKGSNAITASEGTTNSSLKSIELPKLTKIAGNFLIENFWKLSSLDVSSLNNIDGELEFNLIRTIKEIDLPALEYVKGNFTIQSNDGMTRFTAPKLATTGKFLIASLNMYSINLTSLDLSNLKTVYGDFNLSYAACKDVTLPSLTKVDGTLFLNSLSFIESLNVPQLTSCQKIRLSSLTLLEKFDISKIQDLADIDISTCKNLTELICPTTITGNLKFVPSSQNQDFSIIKGLENVEGEVNLASFSYPTLEVLGIKKIGKIAISANRDIVDVSFPKVENIGTFSIINASKMETLSLPQLARLESFNITNCIKLSKMEFSKLAEIDGLLKFYGASNASGAKNSLIKDFDTFSSLNSVGSVDIKYAGSLADFTGLKNTVSKLNASLWSVSGCQYNPTFQDMLNGKYTEN